MPEQYLYLNRGNNPYGEAISLNPDDKLTLSKRDDGSYDLLIEGAAVTGEVHEVSIGPGGAGGVAKVWPPMTEAQTVSKAEERGLGPDEKVPASERKAASAAEKKAASGDAQPADENEDGTPASKTAGETPPASGGKAGTGFSGQVAP